MAQTDGNVVSSKGKVSLNKAAAVPFNPEGTSMPMNHPAQILAAKTTSSNTLQAGNGANNTFQNINYDNFDGKSISGFGAVGQEQYNQVNPVPVRAVRTLRRQPNSFNPNNSPIMNEMYEDVNLPQPVLASRQQSNNNNNSGFSSMPFIEGQNNNNTIVHAHQQQPYDNVVTNKHQQQLRGVSTTLPGYF